MESRILEERKLSFTAAKPKVISAQLGSMATEIEEEFKSGSRHKPNRDTDNTASGSRHEPNRVTDMADVVSSIYTRLSNIPALSSQCCIYRVPISLRKINEKAYTPRIISIGPFHRGAEKLKPMEVHKSRYVQDFLNREPKNSIEYYVQNLRGLEERARRCYGEPLSLKSDAFVEMMLVDGSFIIEFMLKPLKKELIDVNDPIFSTPWMYNTIRDDMLLIENQLPFFVLERLFNLMNCPDHKHTPVSFVVLSNVFVKVYTMIGRNEPVTKNSENQVQHFLDILRQCYLIPSSPRIPPKGGEQTTLIPSATELQGAGVQFRKGTGDSFLDINFTKNGVLEIPPITIRAQTEVVFRNVIAFEHLFQNGNDFGYFNGDSRLVTDYALLMDSLINTPNDVALLRRYGIIDNWLGGDEDVSLLFNNIVNGELLSSSFYYAQLFEDVNYYYKKRRNIWRSKLKRDYFNTPWSTISFIAAVVLLICTILQAVFAVLSD